jgi:hypothetical protein
MGKPTQCANDDALPNRSKELLSTLRTKNKRISPLSQDEGLFYAVVLALAIFSMAAE